MNSSSLSLDRETMRRVGHAVVDMLVDRMTDPEARPIVRATREEMEQRLPSHPRRTGPLWVPRTGPRR
jgi:hypothetical protein